MLGFTNFTFASQMPGILPLPRGEGPGEGNVSVASVSTAIFCAVFVYLLSSASPRASEPRPPHAPYPPSRVLAGISWHWDTHTTAAPGSDLWPVTWGPDNNLYAAWGDGGGFGGSDSDGRVALGFARLEGSPEHFRGININGGKDALHPATFPKRGKTGGLLFVDWTLYASVNLQDGDWPNVDHVLFWSHDRGATWTRAPWLFPRGSGNFQPGKFLNAGPDYSGLPDALGAYVYIYGPKQSVARGNDARLYLARVPRRRLAERAAYEFYAGTDASAHPRWTPEESLAQAVFVDSNGVTSCAVVYNPGLRRFLLSCFHTGPGELGIFDGPSPWGPWTTVAYDEAWGGMGRNGEGLTCDFPQKWMSADGLSLWCAFSVYGPGAKQGIHAHDRFNLVKATLRLAAHP